MPMKPPVTRSLAPFTLPVKIDVVNAAAPAVLRNSRRPGFCSLISFLPSDGHSEAVPFDDDTFAGGENAGTLERDRPPRPVPLRGLEKQFQRDLPNSRIVGVRHEADLQGSGIRRIGLDLLEHDPG